MKFILELRSSSDSDGRGREEEPIRTSQDCCRTVKEGRESQHYGRSLRTGCKFLMPTGKKSSKHERKWQRLHERKKELLKQEKALKDPVRVLQLKLREKLLRS
jgi:hypothetical protein